MHTRSDVPERSANPIPPLYKTGPCVPTVTITHRAPAYFCGELWQSFVRELSGQVQCLPAVSNGRRQSHGGHTPPPLLPRTQGIIPGRFHSETSLLVRAISLKFPCPSPHLPPAGACQAPLSE